MFWQKAFDFANSSDAKIRTGHKMLDVVNKMKITMREKAEEIVRIANSMKREYELQGNRLFIVKNNLILENIQIYLLYFSPIINKKEFISQRLIY